MRVCSIQVLLVGLVGALVNAAVVAQSQCGGGEGADVVVAELPNSQGYGTVNGRAAVAIGTTAANIGTEELWWYDDINQHPVIAQTMYRLKDGRFQQIGNGWLKHGIGALQNAYCECAPSGDFHLLGIGCTDPYTPYWNGIQSKLGPRFEVNAYTGEYPFPPHDFGNEGDNSIFKRLQIPVSMIEAGVSDTMYFAAAQYVAPDDAMAGNGDNNESYRRGYFYEDASNNWYMEFAQCDPTCLTQVGQAALRAWQDIDPEVVEVDVRVPDDGLIIAAVKATDLGNGMWHYEYAIENLNSHRCVSSVSIPVEQGATIDNVGFSDIDYHSGELQDDTPWVQSIGANGQLIWQAVNNEQDGTAYIEPNVLRWATTYNFWFDASVAPESGQVTLSLFRSGSGGPSVAADIIVPGSSSHPTDCPGDIDGDLVVTLADFSEFLVQFGQTGADLSADIDGDQDVDIDDFSIFLVNFGNDCNSPLRAAPAGGSKKSRR